MKNNVVMIGEEAHSFLVNFLEKIGVLLKSYNENKNYEEGQIFLFSFNISEITAKKKIERINNLNKKIYIILPRRLEGFFVNELHRKIHYPVKISVFKNLIKTIFDKNQLFGDLLIKGNYIENINGKIRAYLTETQIDILKILISGKKIKKDEIKKNILQIINSLDTKSLESHLSRIRKKLTEIESKTILASVDANYIKLIAPGACH